MFVAFVGIFLTAKRYHIYKEGFAEGKLNRRDFKELNKLGWPVALQMGMETASFSLATIMVGWLGAMALAAHQVMMTIGQLGYMMYYGMAAAVAVRVSNFHGQKDTKAVHHASSAGFHLILLMAIIVSIPLFLLRHQIGGWFTDNAEVTLMVASLIVPFIIYQFGDGMQCNYSNALRGIADVKPVMYIAFIAYFVISLPAGYLFGFVFDWGLTGIWLSFPFGLTSAGLMFWLRFRYRIPQI
jgi:MATE family multidrug resistance protein